MNDFLDTRKSVIISAPAGSGKTEKLARRYISLLENGTEIEKIVAITFTEKAASEIKDRILNILMQEKKDIFVLIKEKTPLMRITTIHSFCQKLITRFAIELGLDPSFNVLDEFNASQLWSESVYDTLRNEKDSPSVFFEYLKLKGLKGWGGLYRALYYIYRKQPYSEFLAETHDERWGLEERQLIEIYKRCLQTYRIKKRELRVIDFNDMEILAYRAITSNPEWLNILYAFDEHTDHILVDEFQDTSSTQWKIIDKLTEEWRSGLGAKRSAGKFPTIFLVGDEKQSIYMFRGANVSVFNEVKNRLNEWLGNEAVYIEARDNYRSLSRIINFTNILFDNLMKGSLTEPWRTKYSPFTPTREGYGSIQLLILDYENNSKLTRLKETTLIANKIFSLVGNLNIYADQIKRKCQYSDIAILLRNRNNLTLLEGALREFKIPYIVVGGIGFYDEPEVAILRELVSFFIDPFDNFSLFEVLRSPLFGFTESMISTLLLDRYVPLFENLKKFKIARFKKIFDLLDKYLSRKYEIPISLLIEEFLTETGGWKIFHEIQRHVNIKKFLRTIEYYESRGMSLIEIKEILIQSKKSNEPKANVNTENLDAVKVMTIHGAKGLQFPVVFIPSLDETVSAKTGTVILDEVDNNIRFAYEDDSTRRTKNNLFILWKEKEHEEEIRLFYVAITRSMDHLFMSGAVKKDVNGKPKITGKLSFIEDAFPGSISGTKEYSNTFKVLREKDLSNSSGVSGIRLSTGSKKFFSEPAYIEEIDISGKFTKWVDVTEDIEIRTRHGEDWVVLGRIFHRLFEEISKGIIDFKKVSDRIDILLSNELSLKIKIDRYRKLILDDFKNLEASGYLGEIILPKDGAFAELPFILQKDNKVYKGRIDRIIITDNTVYIYDYKTFPVRDREIDELKEKYRFQMNIYSDACRNLFSLKTKSFIVFTHKPVSIEI